MTKYKINGLNVNVYGADGNPAIIFVHAFPLSGEMWEQQVKEFEKDYWVITYDLRGFGNSEQEYALNTIDSHADDLFTIINELKINKPVICSLSMGGYILLRALERSQDSFKAAILCDTRSEADTNESKLNRAQQINQIKAGIIKTFYDNFFNNALSKKTIDGNKSTVRTLRNIAEKQEPTTVMETLMTLAARTDTTPFLENIHIPVLILVGEEDKLTPPELSVSMNRKIKGSELIAIPDSGHFPNMENPSAFNGAIRNFLEGL
jgi:pimeloyl-ACP methyl ester carboxylesterase